MPVDVQGDRVAPGVTAEQVLIAAVGAQQAQEHSDGGDLCRCR